MFGRESKNETPENSTSDEVATPVARTAEPHQLAPRSTPTPALARRSVELPSGGTRRPVSAASSDDRKLTVGKGLSVAGEITSCDILVVEGKVEAKLSDGKLLEITEAGQFRGSVEIENADIAGRYDGQLIVHGRLTVRSTGRISGMVKYGELEVNAGGQIIGEMQVVGGGTQAAATPNGYKNAGRYSSAEEESKSDRKSA